MPLVKRLSTWIFRSWGWSSEGPIPRDVPKCLVVVYPHTSNWDFPVGVLLREVYDVDIHFVAKHTLFRPPLGYVMRALGGKSVVRTGNTNFVDAVAATFRREDVFRLCITPEGTRGLPERLKTGYHFMALAAGVPIVFAAFEWDRKVTRWSEPFYVTDDYARTERAFVDFFRGAVAYHPELAYPLPEAAPQDAG